MLVGGAATGAAVAGTASASFPGANGRVLFDSTRSGAINIFSVDPSNVASVHQITTSADVDESPFGSPDGALVVFRSNRVTGNSQATLFITSASADLDQNTLPPDGATALTSGPGDDRDPSFLADGVVLYSHQTPGGNYQLHTVDVVTLVAAPVFPGPTARPAGDDRGQISGTGTDVFTTELSALPSLSTAGAPQNITPSRGPDLHPNWLRVATPRNDVPETRWSVLLPLTGALVGGAGLVMKRRLRRTR